VFVRGRKECHLTAVEPFTPGLISVLRFIEYFMFQMASGSDGVLLRFGSKETKGLNTLEFSQTSQRFGFFKVFYYSKTEA
jgi:hypothetical protein